MQMTVVYSPEQFKMLGTFVANPWDLRSKNLRFYDGDADNIILARIPRDGTADEVTLYLNSNSRDNIVGTNSREFLEWASKERDRLVTNETIGADSIFFAIDWKDRRFVYDFTHERNIYWFGPYPPRIKGAVLAVEDSNRKNLFRFSGDSSLLTLALARYHSEFMVKVKAFESAGCYLLLDLVALRHLQHKHTFSHQPSWGDYLTPRKTILPYEESHLQEITKLFANGAVENELPSQKV